MSFQPFSSEKDERDQILFFLNMPIRLPLYKFLKEDGNSTNFSRRSLCRFSPSYLSQGIVFDVPLPQNLMPFPPPPPPQGESEILLILILLIVLLKRKMHGKEEELEEDEEGNIYPR